MAAGTTVEPMTMATANEIAAQEFSNVVANHRLQIFRFLLASTRDVDLAETLTQECFLKAHRNWSHFRGDSSAMTWLMRIAINLQKDHWRNRRMQFWRQTRTNAVDLDEASEWLPSGEGSAERQLLARERVGQVWEAVKEVRIAQAAFPKEENKLLLGTSATETAFKSSGLDQYRVIHLAVHGFADSTFPDRAALVLLSDRSAGEDGFLQASEIVQLRFDADLVVLSACDTAVGPLQGQEGIANLSRAFLLAGARTVVSTLWQVDDSSSLFLMKHFYAHLSANRSAASALTAAKRDMLRTLGRTTLPYQWAGFTIRSEASREP